jgi:putative flippase GtrA
MSTRRARTPGRDRKGWRQLSTDVVPGRGAGRGPFLRSAAKFAVVGVVNTGVYYASYLALRLAMPYFAANLLALLVAMVVSFFLNCYWTFRTRPTWRKAALWPLTNATNYVVVSVGVVVCVEWLGIDSRLAPLLSAIVAVPLTFLLSRKVLAGRGARAQAEATGATSVAPAALPLEPGSDATR